MASRPAGSVFVEFVAKTDKFDKNLMSSGKSLQQYKKGLAATGRASSQFNTSLKSLATGFLAPTAALAAFTAGLTAMVKAGTDAEKQQGVITALLKSTGGAAGQTALDIENLSQSIARSTLQSVGGVRQGAAALLTFKNVAGDAFGRTLRVAADLSAVMGTDLKSSVLQLGKALEDPERNLSQLNRSGISFSQTQQQMIKDMVRSGNQAGAMAEILKVLEGQLGGAGAGQNQGLSGRFDSLTQSIGNFFEKVSQEGGVLSGLAAGIELLDTAVQNINKSLSLEGQLGKAIAEVKRLEGDPTSNRAFNQSLIEARQRVDDLTFALEDLQDGQDIATNLANAGKEANEQAAAADVKRTETLERVKVANTLAAEAAQSYNAALEWSNKLDEQSAEQKDRFLEKFEDEVATSKAAVGLSRLSNTEREIELETRMAIIEAQRKGIELSDEEIARMKENIRTRVETDAVVEENTRRIDEWGNVGRQSAETIGEGLADIATEGGTVNDIIKDLIRLMIEFGLKKILIDDMANSFHRMGQVIGNMPGPGQNSGSGGILGSLFGGLLGGGGGGGFFADNFGSLFGGANADSVFGAGGTFSGDSFFQAGGEGLAGFAEGGHPPVGQVSVVGERGPELFVPNSAGQIIPNNEMGAGMGGNVYNIDARGADQGAVDRIEQALYALAGPGVTERRAITGIVSEHNRQGARLFK